MKIYLYMIFRMKINSYENEPIFNSENNIKLSKNIDIFFFRLVMMYLM